MEKQCSKPPTSNGSRGGWTESIGNSRRGPQGIGPPYDARGQNLCLAPVLSLGDSSGWFSNSWTKIASDMFFLLPEKNDKMHSMHFGAIVPRWNLSFYFSEVFRNSTFWVRSKTEFHIQFMKIMRGKKTMASPCLDTLQYHFFGEIAHFKAPKMASHWRI